MIFEVSPQLQHFGTVYTELKYWLPLLTIGTIIWKAKSAITVWADTLLNNHLHSIQAATQSTETETKKTNSLLEDNTGKLDMLQGTVHDHQEKQLVIFQGIVNTLSVLEDRTRSRSGSPKKRAAHAKRK
jgi:hypothetical protein